MKKTTSIIIFLATKILSAWGQSEIPVDMFTGTPTIQIPLYTVQDFDLMEDISLYYSANGVKLDESNGLFGIGWRLNAGGSVTRELRGLPDDFTGIGSDLRRGWLFGTTASSIQSFAATSDLSSATCSDETADYNALNGFNYNIDSEPDIFRFNFGSFSGNFVFDQTGAIRLIPFQDIKIEKTTFSTSTQQIENFIITTNQGYKYTFSTRVNATRSTAKLTSNTSVEFLKRDFEFFSSARFPTPTSFVSEWKLTKIESPSGATITFTYESPVNSGIQVDTVSVAIRQHTVSSFVNHAVYSQLTSTESIDLSSVSSTSGTVVAFVKSATGDFISKVSVFDVRRIPDLLVKEYVFGYHKVYLNGVNLASNSKLFLKNIQESAGCDRLPPYSFKYYGVTFENNYTSLPNRFSKSKDFWGYFNGKSNTSLIPKMYVYPQLALAERYRLTPLSGVTGYTLDGADRTPDYLSMAAGTLEEIVYPSGGSAKMIFEPNDYYDAVANQSLMAGGLRIKQINYFDGVNLTETVKIYEYKDPLNRSSGKLLIRPAFAIPVWQYRNPVSPFNTISYATLNAGNQQTMWEYLTARSLNDLNSQELFSGSTVGYTHVKVSRPGSGYATFEYSLPGSYGTSTVSDWVPTDTKFARANSCPTMGVAGGAGPWGVAYAPNPNAGFERGLLLKKEEYSEQNVKVRQLTNTYQRLIKSGTHPFKVWGLKYDKYAQSSQGIFFYGKYFFLTDVENALSSTVETVYDGAGITTTKDFFYESTYHKLLTRIKQTNSDGTTFFTKMRYPLDFGTIPSTGTDKAAEMIRKLQTEFRNGIPLEQIESIKKGTAPELTIQASLTQFSDFGTTKVLPQKIYSLNIPSGISDFSPAFILLQGGTHVLKPDTRYVPVKTYLAYDDFHLPVSMVDQSRVNVSKAWGYFKTVPVVDMIHTTPAQIAFSDFETTTNVQFSQTGGNLVNGGRTGAKSIDQGVALSRTIQKGNAPNYIFSCWLKKNVNPITINIKLVDDELSVLFNQAYVFTPAGTDFEYFERTIPVSALPNVFKIEVSAPLRQVFQIDDVAFYPENGEIKTYTYDLPYGITSETSSNGLTAYQSYDKLGRIKYQLDHKKNIRKKFTYKYSTDPAPLLSASFEFSDPTHDNVPITFTANENCLDGVVYEWDFGSGFVTGNRIQQFTYTTTGVKSITLRKTHPNHPTVTSTRQLTVTLKPLDVTICAKGASIYDFCAATVVYSHTCSQITTPVTGAVTLFKPMTISGGNGTYTYQWYKKVVATNQIIALGTTLEISHSQYYHGTSDFYCVVADSQGRVGTSNLMRVEVVITDPNCSPFGN